MPALDAYDAAQDAAQDAIWALMAHRDSPDAKQKEAELTEAMRRLRVAEANLRTACETDNG